MAGYIGSKVAVVSSGAERKKVFTATSGQTSFTGLSYTVNNVHVFQNGVRLVDGTDYTATNGNSITLTVGAATDDQVVVVSYNTFQTSDTVSASTGGTFAGDVNFTGAFTSQGIDDNSTSTALTLDASGNLLVGTTTTQSLGTVNSGSLIRDGYIQVASTDATATLAYFYGSSGQVGSIGCGSSSRLIINGDSNGIAFQRSGTEELRIGNNVVQPSDDNDCDLGLSFRRFKDLYLSGGVYLGGTGSANKLDDYEEGTWTPEVRISNSTVGITYDNRHGFYTKIGRVVHLNGTVTLTNKGSNTGSIFLHGQPFSIANLTDDTSLESGSQSVDWYSNSNGLYHLSLICHNASSGFSFYKKSTATANLSSSAVAADIGNTFSFRISMTYLTNA